MNRLLPQPVWQIIDANGAPIAGALVHTYKAGTDDDLETYVSADSTLPASNPLVADAAGRLEFWGGADAYKLVIMDADENIIWTLDNETLGSGAGSGSLYVVDTIAALKALTTAYSIVVVLGYYAKYDGGGGTFYWDSASTTSDDAGYTITPDSAPSAGRYIRQDKGDVNVRFFGARTGSYGSTNKVAFEKAVAYAYAGGLNVLVPQGAFLLSDTVAMTSVQTKIDPLGSITTAYGKAPSIIPLYHENDIYPKYTIGSGADPALKYPTEPAETLIRPHRYKTPGYRDYEMIKNQLRGLKLTCTSVGIESPTADEWLTISVAQGNAGMTNAAMIAYNASATTKILKGSWTAGNAAAGLPSSLTATKDTWYHVFLISNKGGDVDFGFDTSLTAANLLADATQFTYYRRIGSVLCSKNDCETITFIQPFIQYGDWFYYIDSSPYPYPYIINSITESTVEGIKTAVLVGAPIGYPCKTIGNWFVVIGGKQYNVGSSFGPNNCVMPATTGGVLDFYNAQLIIQTDDDSKFGYELLQAGESNLIGLITAYEDIRGKE